MVPYHTSDEISDYSGYHYSFVNYDNYYYVSFKETIQELRARTVQVKPKSSAKPALPLICINIFSRAMKIRGRHVSVSKPV